MSILNTIFVCTHVYTARRDAKGEKSTRYSGVLQSKIPKQHKGTAEKNVQVQASENALVAPALVVFLSTRKVDAGTSQQIHSIHGHAGSIFCAAMGVCGVPKHAEKPLCTVSSVSDQVGCL